MHKYKKLPVLQSSHHKLFVLDIYLGSKAAIVIKYYRTVELSQTLHTWGLACLPYVFVCCQGKGHTIEIAEKPYSHVHSVNLTCIGRCWYNFIQFCPI